VAAALNVEKPVVRSGLGIQYKETFLSFQYQDYRGYFFIGTVFVELFVLAPTTGVTQVKPET